MKLGLKKQKEPGIKSAISMKNPVHIVVPAFDLVETERTRGVEGGGSRRRR